MVSFFLGMLLIGGMGIWVPYIFNRSENDVFLDSQALFTYSLAILGTIFIEYALSKKDTGDKALLAILLGVISFCLCIYGYYETNAGFEKYTAFGAALSMTLFILANANDEKYDSDDEPPKASSTGYKTAEANRITDE